MTFDFGEAGFGVRFHLPGPAGVAVAGRDAAQRVAGLEPGDAVPEDFASCSRKAMSLSWAMSRLPRCQLVQQICGRSRSVGGVVSTGLTTAA